MYSLIFHTANEESYLAVYEDLKKSTEKVWQAHRTLSDTLLESIEQVVSEANLEPRDVGGIVVFKGPGSFTGLRIGITVANTMADALNIPIIGSQGDSWIETGIERLQNGESDSIVLPEYGGEANITKPKK